MAPPSDILGETPGGDPIRARTGEMLDRGIRGGDWAIWGMTGATLEITRSAQTKRTLGVADGPGAERDHHCQLVANAGSRRYYDLVRCKSGVNVVEKAMKRQSMIMGSEVEVPGGDLQPRPGVSVDRYLATEANKEMSTTQFIGCLRCYKRQHSAGSLVQVKAFPTGFLPEEGVQKGSWRRALSEPKKGLFHYNNPSNKGMQQTDGPHALTVSLWGNKV
ncbi:hypothetical protein An03g05570 [Aspergillus niger]|uniref:Uncharacterized protein n=2 Tax=Aspergillus niger TaxID=5061 RepID=A2QH48_ASPNC|nr:hypothetical protein An03g05570 [Aspergillus niger]CAK38318.1 hypothetical protein An03g05570 [Aspergillus niger]